MGVSMIGSELCEQYQVHATILQSTGYTILWCVIDPREEGERILEVSSQNPILF